MPWRNVSSLMERAWRAMMLSGSDDISTYQVPYDIFCQLCTVTMAEANIEGGLIDLDLHSGSLFGKVHTKHSRSLYTVEVLYPHLIRCAPA